jgi:hypothetical protein
MKLKVIRCGGRPEDDYYLCREEDGTEHRVDLAVDNSHAVPENRAALVGRWVWVDYLYPHIEIASGVQVLDGDGKDVRYEK